MKYSSFQYSKTANLTRTETQAIRLENVWTSSSPAMSWHSHWDLCWCWFSMVIRISPNATNLSPKTRFWVDPTIVWLFVRWKQVEKAFHYNKSTTLPLPVPKQSPPIFSWSLILSKWSVNIVSKRQRHEGLNCLSGLVDNCCYDVSDVLSINHGIGNYKLYSS